ncbi:MAG: hypothetical protein IPO27_18120 [Bacteroidetes bacterium]|nr:hypothetical protein [Bacteroidota bacterium]
MKRLVLSLAIATIALNVNGQRTARFESSSVIGGSAVPYSDIKAFFAVIDSGSIGSNYFTIYFEIPDSCEELGLRTFSPVPQLTSPNRGDLSTENYFERKVLWDKTFDPAIKLYRAANYKPQNHAVNKEYAWQIVGSNDDSKEMPTQPNMKNGNALVRLTAKSRLIPPGLYNVVIGDNKNTNWFGSFMLNIGVNAHWQGFWMGTDLGLKPQY